MGNRNRRKWYSENGHNPSPVGPRDLSQAWSCEHATTVKENMIVVFYWNIHELGNKDPYLLISVLLMPSSMGLDTWKMLNEYLNE